MKSVAPVPQGRLPADLEDFCVELLGVPALSPVEADVCGRSGFRCQLGRLLRLCVA